MDEEELMSAFRLLASAFPEASEYEKSVELIQRIRAIALNIGFTLKQPNQTKQYINVKGVPIEFDLGRHLDLTILQVDALSEKLDSITVATAHRTLSQLLAKYKQTLTQEKTQMFSSVKYREDSPSRTLRISQELPNSNDAGKQDELKEELQDEIYNMTEQLKKTAQEINRQLQKDKELISAIEKKQDKGLTEVTKGSSRINRILNSKSLSCTTLFFMLAVSMFLFVFGMMFIRFF